MLVTLCVTLIVTKNDTITPIKFGIDELLRKDKANQDAGKPGVRNSRRELIVMGVLNILRSDANHWPYTT